MTPQQLVQEVSQLFTLPDVAIRLNELIAAADSSTGDLVEVVQLDPGLAAAVLKLANSAHYGLVARVDSIPRALAVIGQQELQVMAMATSVTTTFRGLPADLLDMASFWDNSVTCGVIARLLGRRCRLPKTDWSMNSRCPHPSWACRTPVSSPCLQWPTSSSSSRFAGC